MNRPAPHSPRITLSSIAAYYDANTPSFMKLGGSHRAGAIHRQLWLEHVHSTEQALEALHALVAQELAPALPPSGGRVLDLGCGVGGALTWLVRHLNIHTTGITLSPVQARMAGERIQSLGLEQRCQVKLGNMLDLPKDLGVFDGALAIESFSHATDADAFFGAASRALKPGARLVISDDFLVSDSPPSHEAARWIEQFRSGWHFPNLITLQEAQDSAERHGFRLFGMRKLTPYLRLANPWLMHAAGLLMSLPLRCKVWQSWRGSVALQICLHNGWTEYAMQTWLRG